MFMATALRKVALEMPLLWRIRSVVGLQQVSTKNSRCVDILGPVVRRYGTMLPLNFLLSPWIGNKHASMNAH